MRGSRNFSSGGGGGGQSDKKALTTLFVCVCVFLFFILSLFYGSEMVIFKEIYHFSRFQRGSNILPGGGGSNFFQVGSNCLFPVETHITCDFPGGGGGSDPLSPLLDPHLVHVEHMIPWLRAQRRFALKLIGVFTESFGLFIRQLNYYVSR